MVNHKAVRLRSHLVPEHGAQERFLMGTDENTPFFQVPRPEFGHGDRAPRPCTRAMNWALIPCVHTFFVSSLALYPQTTALRTHNSLVCLHQNGI